MAARLEHFAQHWPGTERVELGSAAGRVLASSLLADADQPPFPRSTRDGFACRAAEITGHTSLPIAGTTRAGEAQSGELPGNAAWEIMTGAPVPKGADCVVMLEHVAVENGRLRLDVGRTIAVGENIVPQGAQARKGDELLPAGTAMSFAQIALAAACGQERLEVFARPRVAILSTGDEVVPVGMTPGPAQIRNSNGPMLAALVTAAGGDPLVLPIAPDSAEALDAAIAQARHAEMLLVTGGVSAGKFDLVEPALARAGASKVQVTTGSRSQGVSSRRGNTRRSYHSPDVPAGATAILTPLSWLAGKVSGVPTPSLYGASNVPRWSAEKPRRSSLLSRLGPARVWRPVPAALACGLP